MHEFSLMESILNIAKKELEKYEGEVRPITINIVVGKMRQVVPEFIENAFRFLSKNTIFQGCSLHLKEIPVVVRCSNCGREGELGAGESFVCQNCKGNFGEIIHGKEFFIESIEIEIN